MIGFGFGHALGDFARASSARCQPKPLVVISPVLAPARVMSVLSPIGAGVEK